MILLVLIGLLIVLWKLEPAVRRRSAMRGAGQMQQSLRDLYAKELELVEARPEDFPHLDLAFYDSTTQLLERRGFRVLGNLEDRTLINRHARRTFVRIFTDDRAIGVAVYNFQLAGWARWITRPMRNLRVVDVCSELSDGAHLCSTNAWHARHLERPRQFDTLFHPPTTAAAVLLAEHEERLGKHRERHPDATPIVDLSLLDVVASMKRSHRLKAAHRARSDFMMSRDELRGFADDSGKAAIKNSAVEVADAFEAGEIEPPLEPSRQRRGLVWNVVLWLLLVVVFAVVYGWTAR